MISSDWQSAYVLKFNMETSVTEKDGFILQLEESLAAISARVLSGTREEKLEAARNLNDLGHDATFCLELIENKGLQKRWRLP